MKKLALLVATATLLATSFTQAAEATNARQDLDARQALIEQQMELLAESQNTMQLEIQSHFKRSQSIQRFQICVQAADKKDDFRICKMQFKKDQKSLDEEVLALRKMRN